MPVLTPENTIFFLCDIQAIFQTSISGFDHIVFTANKLLKLAKIIECEVVSCTQASKALGPLASDIDFSPLGNLHLGTFDKSSFSMITPDIQNLLLARPNIKNVIIFGIEAHICVLQTALALRQPSFREEPYTPYVIADCIASHNSWEVPITLQRLMQEGVVVSTSESIGFQLIGDAKHPKFKAFSSLTKESKEGTMRAGEALIAGRKSEYSLPVKTSL